MKCRCGFKAGGGSHHLDAHLRFYAKVPGQAGKHGVAA